MSFTKDWMSIKDAAEQLGLSEVTLRRMIAKREIGFLRFGSGRGRIRFSRKHIDEYKQRREVQAIAA